jgi:hypothetical protein
MLKKYSIIIILIFSYTVVLGHGIFAHHHHEAFEVSDHHDDDHDDDDHDHSLFSFGTIEDNFIPGNPQVTVNSNVGIQLFTFLHNFSLIDTPLFEREIVYSTYQEFPPPENYHHSCGLRAPPIC